MTAAASSANDLRQRKPRNRHRENTAKRRERVCAVALCNRSERQRQDQQLVCILRDSSCGLTTNGADCIPRVSECGAAGVIPLKEHIAEPCCAHCRPLKIRDSDHRHSPHSVVDAVRLTLCALEWTVLTSPGLGPNVALCQHSGASPAGKAVERQGVGEWKVKARRWKVKGRRWKGWGRRWKGQW